MNSSTSDTYVHSQKFVHQKNAPDEISERQESLQGFQCLRVSSLLSKQLHLIFMLHSLPCVIEAQYVIKRERG